MSMGLVYSAPMLILLRLIHIGSGVFWVGGAVFAAVFLTPAVRALGPAGGPVMQQIVQVRKMPLYLLVSGLLTVLSGLGLYWHDSAGFTNGFAGSPGGITFGTGAVFAFLALGVGLGVAAPTAKKVGALAAAIAGAGKPTPDQAAEMQRLQMKIGKAGGIAAAFLALATLAMAVARYVG